MLKAQLGNEFGEPTSQAYKSREEAFTAYNEVVEQAPDKVVRIMATLAMGEEVTYEDKTDKDVYHAAMHVLDVTNNGTQIGVALPVREAAWAEVFADNGHREAVQDYARFSREPHSSEAIEASRKRGLHALKVIALTHLAPDERMQILTSFSSDTPKHIAAA